MKPAAPNSFDVAVWFLDRARAEDGYIQPRRLQCLLFLAQAHFVAIYKGRRLMPSVFLFDEGGPIDPNLYRAFEAGRPAYTENELPDYVLALLEGVWRRYAGFDTLRLDQLIARRGREEACIQRRDGSEIGIAAMRRMFGGSTEKKANPASKVMRSHTGRRVTVKKWTPARRTAVD